MIGARLVGVGGAIVALVPGLAADSSDKYRGEFAASYCVSCHGGAEPQGGFHAADGVPDGASPEQWRRASEYVAKGVMPPTGAAQPTDAEREAFSRAVLLALGKGAGTKDTSTGLVRHLNRTEYLNTLRDLFGIRELRLPVTFPDDNPDLRFDTMVEGTHLSPGHLDAFGAVATEIADRMVPLGTVSQVDSGSARDTVGQDASRTPFWQREGDESGLYFTGVNIAGWSGALWDRAFTAPVSGTYKVRLKVSAEAELGADGKPLRLGFYALNPSDYDLPKRALRVDLPRVGELEVSNREPEFLEADVLLEKGEGFHVYCENRLSKGYPDALIRTPGNTADLRRL
ncbi:MAG: DUF1587 domain-containing protein [Bryobacterales bacterium]|nr:DUF1587 domain-containing protein [Bryobacterales bacterium]